MEFSKEDLLEIEKLFDNAVGSLMNNSSIVVEKLSANKLTEPLVSKYVSSVVSVYERFRSISVKANAMHSRMATNDKPVSTEDREQS